MPVSELTKRSSYACGESNAALLGKCIGELLDDTASKYPEQDCLVVRHQSRRYSYRQFREEVDIAAKGFLHLGIKKGDRIAMWSTNSAEWVITQFAAAKVGAILVNINPLNRAFELEHVLRQSECQTLLLTDGFRDIDYTSTLQQLCPELSTCEPGKLESSALPHLRNVICLGDAPVQGTIAWLDFIRDGKAVTLNQLRSRENQLSFDDAINIQYTSGTTGLSKGATLSHHNLVNNGKFIAHAMRFTHRDRLCIPVPFYHCFGMVLSNIACVASGAAMIVPAAAFDPELTLLAVQEERCTALHGVPTMFIAELGHPNFSRYNLRTLRTGIMAGSPCPIEIMRRVVNEMCCRELIIVYGLTEASPGVTQTTTDDPVELRVTTVGRALPHTEIKLIDSTTGQLVPLGTTGELCTRGYHVMKGYYRDAEATHSTIDMNGWLHTGDLAVMDERGYFKITGRVKDVIIRGGENIYPREVEEFLYTHPLITSAQVFGVPDAKYGEAVATWVTLMPGSVLSHDELVCFCKGRIADFKIPRYLKVVDQFPLTVTGKAQKFRMRELSIEEFGLQSAAGIETA
jgi:fatty-acyl-CoA synthase